MTMIGAPAWLFGNQPHFSLAPSLPQVQLGAPGEWIPGGRASGRSPASFDPTQLAAGIRVELEHTNNWRVAREIAMDHLTEDPAYYIKLAQVHLDGLGITRARWADGLGLTRSRWAEAPNLSVENQGQLEGINDLFDSWQWRNRKWLVLGGAGLLGLGVLGLAGALLR